MADPPFEVGAVQVSVAEALPAVADAPEGAPANVAGVTTFEAGELEPVPTPFAALTVKV